MLCNSCIGAFEKPKFSRISSFIKDKQYLHELQVLHPTFASLEASLEAGCGICHRLVHALRSKPTRSKIFSGSQISSEVELHTFRMRYRLAYETESKTVISCFCLVDAKREGKDVQERCTEFLFFSPEQGPLLNVSAPGAENGINTKSMDIITSWITNCLKSHDLCRRNHAKPLGVPFARILDVGNTVDAAEVRLRSSIELTVGVRYMTLSHCWGGFASQIPSLTTKTYDSYFRGIAVANLPRTFQDTVQLARRLSIQYVWIDSMCIVQDSMADWLEQAAVMGSIYQGSYLNIAATKSEDPSGGLFCHRNPVLITPLRIEIPEAISPATSPPQEQLNDWRWHRLENMSTLAVSTPVSQVEYTESRLDLNRVLGNRDGNFDQHGENFTFSARHLRLQDMVLHAELRTISGEWKHSTIDLTELPEFNSGEQTLPRTFPRLEGSSLVARTPSPDTRFKTYRVDLNQGFGNADGEFDQQDKNFARSAKDVVLDHGHVLSASPTTVGGDWKRNSVHLSNMLAEPHQATIENVENVVLPAKRYYDVGTDYYETWSRQVSRSKLCRRGWVVQERLLAPRVVHFGTQQLFFECVQSRSIEQQHDLSIDSRQNMARRTRLDFKAWDVFSADLVTTPRSRTLGVNYVWSSVKAMYGRNDIRYRREDLANDQNVFMEAKRMCYGEEEWEPTLPLIKYWSMIQITYHAAQLTYREDRLLAIAGLARILSERTGISYIAGLWKRQLSRQLLWNVTQSQPSSVDKTIQLGVSAPYIAPSWSSASCTGVIGERGFGLDPILETEGAMDLIKILAVDVKGILKQDTMPFGRVKDGRLRIQGRLLPISLDLTAWPDGATRTQEVVQYWVGSTVEPPTGETFLVPVLFIRWNDRLPASTPNSLILESTAQKGVFRRVGIARLSSRCSLKDIMLQLYTAKCIYDEDEEDDAQPKGEPNSEELKSLPVSADAEMITTNPQQELSNKRLDYLTNKTVNGALDMALRNLKIKTVSQNAPSKKQQADRALKVMKLYQSGINMVKADMPGKLPEKIQLEMQSIKDEKNTDGDENMVSAALQRNIRKPVITLAPKEAVAGHFYLEYIEDKSAARYGHFIFELV